MGLEASRILIVGGAGFVGSNLARRCLAEGCERLWIVDNLISSERENVPLDDRVELLEGSITENAILESLPEPLDYVFHLAAYHGNQSSIADVLADHENSLLTTLRLFEHLSRGHNLRRLVYASTGCALAPKGEVSETLPVLEDGPVPLDYDSPYQISKLVGEMYALYFGRHGNVPIVRARFQNVYGPGEVLGAGRWRGTPHTVWRNVTPTFIYRSLKHQPLLIHGDGGASRDFIFVEDLVEGLVRCATTPGAEGDVFNLASGNEVSIRQLAEEINRLTGSPRDLEFVPVRGWDRSINRVGSPTKSKNRLGFEAQVDWKTGLQRTIGWTRENLDWIDRCVHQHAEHLEVDF